MSTTMEPNVEAFWQAYLATLPDPEQAEERYYEAFTIGDTLESANNGAALILSGEKTTTSDLLWRYEATGEPMMTTGSLSIVLDGEGHPVCVVETTTVKVQPFDEIDGAFACAYGEWDRTLEGWRTVCWDYYAEACRELGREPSADMPLVCEWLVVVHRPTRR